MNAPERKTDWADDEDGEDLAKAIPPPQITKNKDGTETIVTIFLNDEGKRVKRTQRIKRTVIKKRENPRVAERRTWAKFGAEASRSTGPHPDTTTLGENIVFRPISGFKSGAKEEKPEEDTKTQALKQMKIKCRICSGDHFTSKCPFRDTMAPEGDAAGAGADGADTATNGADESAGGLGKNSGGYVPPHLRGGKTTGERMGGGGKYERDDLATLRVTNVSEYADENELRDLFERFGHVTRVFLAKDRETNLAKGFAFISYVDRDMAARAMEKMDGHGYNNLILRVEFAKKAT
ncbi:translation initiation factor eIF3 subunit g [Elasticomyces elasticus]|nr:hypothetical protein LTR28_003197 [Elasticomyces elasticus]KAK4997236.1 translation initiation factor eIF3 subunit g [Elasticomyces elasticus]